jgi:RNA polymerase sigma factor (sigma-70 family)
MISGWCKDTDFEPGGENHVAEQEPFADFFQRIRAGDQQAAADLVRRYESVIRREVRMRLNDPSLYRLVDSIDVCQSVLNKFFLKAAVGAFDLEQPQQLVALLVGMAHNKVISLARKQKAQRRDARRLERAGVEQIDPVGSEATPSRVASGKELLEQVRQRLSPEDRQVADLRGQGFSWPEIAAQVGGTPDGRRVQLSRALDRVSQQLGLDEDGEE